MEMALLRLSVEDRRSRLGRMECTESCGDSQAMKRSRIVACLSEDPTKHGTNVGLSDSVIDIVIHHTCIAISSSDGDKKEKACRSISCNREEVIFSHNSSALALTCSLPFSPWFPFLFLYVGKNRKRPKKQNASNTRKKNPA